MFVDLKDSDNSRNKSQIAPTSNSGSAQQFRADIINDNDALDKLCTPCVGSKSTRVVRRNKSMTPTTNKLEEVHADLWGPHDPPSQFGSTYAAILICEHTRKTWILYLRGKDDFIDAFQAWLPRAKSESECSMKVLRANGRGKFISNKVLNVLWEERHLNKVCCSVYALEKWTGQTRWRTIVTMKDSMLIDSRLPNGFWAEVMETANYLQNRLPTRSKTHGKMISEEA